MSTYNWSNWAGNLHSDAEVVTPHSLEALCTVVSKANASGKRVRATGASLSWAPLVPVPSDDVIVCLDAFKGMTFDEDAKTVEVECGVSVAELSIEAAKRGLTIISPTLYPKPTMGGAVAVGAHGTDFAHGGISDPVIGMQLIDARGEVRRLEADDPDLPAARVALGTLGLLHSITLKLQDNFHVATDIRILPVPRVLDHFDDLQASCDFLEMFWFPFSDTMAVYIMDRTESPLDPVTWWSRFKTYLQTELQSVSAQTLLPWIAKNAPQATPFLNRLASRMAFPAGFNISPASVAFHFQRAYAKCWEMEYAVPAEYASDGWHMGIDLVNHYANADLYPINLTLHGRFTGPSSCWMAPNYNRPTCYIDLTTALATPHWEGFFRELESEWCGIEGARPHWAKLYFQTERLHEQYAMMQDFLAVRERWDPERRFLNRFLEQKVFQLAPEADELHLPYVPELGSAYERSFGRSPHPATG